MSNSNYYIPESSPWPIVATIGLFATAFGAANFIQQATGKLEYFPGGEWGKYVFAAGAVWLLITIALWWRDTINESIGGLHRGRLNISYRQGMGWFIFSEVMFFGAFFGALFYTRWLAIPWLGGAGSNAMTHELLWPNFQPMWPLLKTPGGTVTEAMQAWGLPAINTAVLLSSSVTLTFAHQALLEGRRVRLILFQAATVLLGLTFLGLQAHEYYHAYTHLGLTLDAGIYGSLFFVMTGFHGVHVTVGTLFLIVTLSRVVRGHFSKDNDFAWEAAAWYWHFVDIVWLFLFVSVYWL